MLFKPYDSNLQLGLGISTGYKDRVEQPERRAQKVVGEEYSINQDTHTLWYPGPIHALQQLDNLTIPPAA